MTLPEAIRPERRDWLPILTFAFAIFLQTGFAIWWAAGIDGRVKAVEQDISANAAQIDLLQQAQSDSAAFMARIDERLTAQAASLARIERLLESTPKP